MYSKESTWNEIKTSFIRCNKFSIRTIIDVLNFINKIVIHDLVLGGYKCVRGKYKNQKKREENRM